MQENDLQGIRHTLAHLLACSVRNLFPGAKNTIGPAIEDGFYQDFDVSGVSEKDLPRIEKEMRKVLKTWGEFERREVTVEDALKEFEWNEYKSELIRDLARESKTISFYVIGGFVDLCKGGHANDARIIDPDAFKLT
ncbi:MAG TPA: threonine--tRNA ligase, partial [Patescibacteria group bacterium]|nr:threonine--tRNA ligase [Patescibacteria group bacterium]